MAGQAAEGKSAAAAWVEGGSCGGWEEEGRLLFRLLQDCEQQQQEVEEEQEEERFTGHSCLLITWKTNPEIEKFKVRRLFEQFLDLCLTR